MLAVLHEVLQSYWHSLKNSVGTLLVVALWIIMFRCGLACAARCRRRASACQPAR